MKLKVFRNYLPLILILLLALLLRFFWLDKVPNAIGGDELVYVVTAKSIALSSSNLTGVWNPLSIFLFNYPPNEGQAELPYFLFLPLVGFLKFSLFNARATNAILGVLVVFLIYLISSKLFNKKVGLIAAFVASINPWFIYISRTAYESMPAVFFYLASFYSLLFFKGRKILFSIPLLFFAFYSYIATKVFFIPFVLTMLSYVYFLVGNKKFKKEYLIVLASSIFLIFIFLISLSLHPESLRAGEFIDPNNPEIARRVDAIRSISMQNPLTIFLENKYTETLKVVLVKVFSVFSSGYLFLTGDNFFSIWNNGLFYYIDAIFLGLGALFVFSKNRKVFFLFSLLIIFATVPHLIYRVATENFTIHISMIFPFLIIFIAVGIWEVINFFKNKGYFYISSLAILIIYVILTINFFNIYFYQFPLQGYFDFRVRILAKYANLSQSKQETIVYSSDKLSAFKEYLFYANALNKNSLLQIRKDIVSNKYKIGNVVFTDCDDRLDPSKTENVIIYDSNCAPPKTGTNIIIPRLIDGGKSYGIYNDNVCSEFSLKSFPSKIKVSDFSIEDMSAQKFCETFITTYNL